MVTGPRTMLHLKRICEDVIQIFGGISEIRENSKISSYLITDRADVLYLHKEIIVSQADLLIRGRQKQPEPSDWSRALSANITFVQRVI